MENAEPNKKMLDKSQETIDYRDLEKYLFCGLYQIIVAIIYQIASFIFGFNLIFMPFMIFEPTWRCDSPRNSSSDLFNGSLSSDRCAMLRNGECSGPTWYNWDLVCDKKHIVYDILSIQMAALLLGTLLIGRMADRFGRKPVLLSTMIGQGVLGIATAFANSWQVFATCRFFAGLFGAGLMSVVGVYVVENVSKSNRLLIIAIGGVNIGIAFSSLLAFAFQHWRPLSIAASSFGFVTALLLVGTRETPRWLIQHGKTEEARKSYRYILRINQKQAEQMTDEQWDTLIEYAQRRSGKRPTFCDLFRRRELFTQTVVLSYSILLMFSMDDLVGSIYLNSAIYGLFNWLGGIVCSFVDRTFRRFGRKHMVGTLLSVVIVCMLCMTLEKWLELNHHLLQRAVVFVAAFASSPLWISLSLVIMESFPTALRSTVSGISSTLVNVGGLVVPQLLWWVRPKGVALQSCKDNYFEGTIWKPIPWIVVVVAAVSSQLTFLLKISETKGKPLMEGIGHRDETLAPPNIELKK
ncbi:Organic cation transporter protein [Trichuris trichiura]|uniref:Organic cation transporter protein n=1 Tax=Trichuris trichiura TaxID=36087 RepID=A0A077YXM1_TRITR|nr:Organic cation transporter protein [Trichuris trichiura]